MIEKPHQSSEQNYDLTMNFTATTNPKRKAQNAKQFHRKNILKRTLTSHI